MGYSQLVFVGARFYYVYIRINYYLQNSKRKFLGHSGMLAIAILWWFLMQAGNLHVHHLYKEKMGFSLALLLEF